MAIDVSDEVEWHWLLKVVTKDESTTRRYADSDLPMSDGFVWEGFLSDFQPVVFDERLASVEDSREVFSDMEVVFDDPEAEVYNTVIGDGWAGGTVTISVGQGLDLADYVDFPTSVVQYPGMLRRTIDKTVVRIQDKRRADATTVPPRIYSVAAFDAIDTLQADAVATATIEVSDASQFKVGDIILIAGDPGPLVRSNTAQVGGGAAQIKLDAGASGANGFYNGMHIHITAGSGVDEEKDIVGYAGASKFADVDSTWLVHPDATSTFEIHTHVGWLITAVDTGTNELILDDAVTFDEDDEIAWQNHCALETKSIGKSVPIGTGDWLTTAGNGEMLPAVCIDTNVPRFKVFEHAMPDGKLAAGNDGKAVKTTASGDTDVTADLVNIDYNRATFELGTVPYDPATDTIYVNCQGRTVDGTKDTAVIADIPSQWEDFLINYMGQVDADIDQAALTAWKAAVTDLGRRFINTPESSDTAIGAWMFDAFSDLDFRGTKYFPIFRSLEVDPDAPVFDLEDIVDDGTDDDPSPLFEIDTDPDLYLNRATVEYRWDPRNGVFAGSGQVDDDSQQKLTGLVRSRPLTFVTIYVLSEAQDRASRELLAFGGQDIQVVRTTLTQRGVSLLNLASNMVLTFDVLDSQQLIIRGMGRDAPGMVNEVTAWNVSTIGIGHWTATGANDFSTSSQQEKQFQGYYTNALGEASAGDPTTKLSKWL